MLRTLALVLACCFLAAPLASAEPLPADVGVRGDCVTVTFSWPFVHVDEDCPGHVRDRVVPE